MSEKRWAVSFRRRPYLARGALNLSQSQFRVLLGATSALVIVASAAFIIWRVCRWDEVDIKPTQIVLICTKCAHEWVPSEEDLQALGQGPQAALALQAGLECKKCRGAKTMRVTIQCPKCGEHYLSQAVLSPRASGAAAARDVCPGCNADYLEARRADH